MSAKKDRKAKEKVARKTAEDFNLASPKKDYAETDKDGKS